jgi:polyhydroxybutyrate depolymerase
MATFDARLVFGSALSAYLLALAAGCSDKGSDFSEGANGGSAGAGVSGSSSGVSGSAGTMPSTGGTGTAGTNAAGQGGSTAGAGNPTGGSAGTVSGAGGAGAIAGAGPSGGAGMGGMAPTTGCGAMTWPPGDGTTVLSMDVDGTAREYIVQIPSAYDTNRPYRLVFAWHGRTGTAGQVARNFYGLENALGDSTIFVSGQGLGTEMDPADTGWPNTNGQDIAFVRALVASLSSAYCIDQNRIMSVGMSYGGIMSYHIACNMPDVFRAIAPIAGASFGGGRSQTCGTDTIAVWGAHGTTDETVTYMSGESARDAYVTRNHCQTTTAPLAPSPCPASGSDGCSCVQYQGCDAGYPVVWCSHGGGHTIPQWTGPGIAAFFQQF